MEGTPSSSPASGEGTSVTKAPAARLRGGGGGAGEADQVARGIDVRDLGLVVRVHLEGALLGGGETGGLEVQRLHVADAPRCHQDLLGGEARAVAERDEHVAIPHLELAGT